MGDVMNDVVDQPEIAVDEVIPRPGLFAQASLDEFTINVAQGHCDASSPGRGFMMLEMTSAISDDGEFSQLYHIRLMGQSAAECLFPVWKELSENGECLVKPGQAVSVGAELRFSPDWFEGTIRPRTWHICRRQGGRTRRM
jgi:hypothetical protein